MSPSNKDCLESRRAFAAGLPAAIKARDAGVSVLVVEANYDVGGHAIVSGGNVPLGGGTSAQHKDSIHDSPDLIFSDLTDWTIVQPNGWPDYRHNGVKFRDVPPDNSGLIARATRHPAKTMPPGLTAQSQPVPVAGTVPG